MRASKVHWCPIGFTTICGAKPTELRIAMGRKTITCNNCRRICGLPIESEHTKPCNVCHGTGRVSVALDCISGTIDMRQR